MEGFGELSPSGEEFVINRPDTPRPWFNLLTNGRYSLRLAQDGRAEQLLGATEEPNSTFRYFYIRDSDTGEFWSPTWQPVGKALDSYRCRYLIGQSDFQIVCDQISVSVDVFVPPNFDGEVWRLNILNLSGRKRRLAIFFAAGLPESVNVAGPDRGLLVASDRRDSTIFHFGGTRRDSNSFDCRLETFLGPYGSATAPQAVVEGRSSRSIAVGEAAIIAFEHNSSLGKNALTKLSYFIGATTDLAATRQAISAFKQPGSIEKASLKFRQSWRERCARAFVQTSDSHLDRLFNHFLRYQALAPSGQAWPSRVKRLIVGLAFEETDRDSLDPILLGQTKDGRLEDIELTIWLIRLLVEYVKETGDFDYFHRGVGYRDGGEGTVLQHFIRALHYCEAARSDEGLISIPAPGDECLESTAATGQLAQSWREALPVLEHFGEHDLVERYAKQLDRLKAAVDRRLRQGRFYSSGIHSTLGKIGAKGKSRQIEAAAQCWLIIGGLIDSKRAEGALGAVRQKLSSKFGTLNFAPAYPRVAEDGFGESADSPGSGRNSTVTTETVAELIWAEALIGQGDGVYKLWGQINPLARSIQPSAYGAEPFLVAETVYGPSHPRFGQAASGWGGAGAGLLWLVLLERIFGIQPVLGGLKIDPCLPKDWRQVEVTRQFRGAAYHIRIQNPFRVSKGIDRIIVDGVRLTGNVIRPFGGGTHFVEVTLG